MKNLDNWVFRFHTQDKVWCAARREHYKELFNNYKSEHVLRSIDVDTLLELISRTGGVRAEIEKLVK